MSEYFHHVLVGLLAVLPVANPLTSVSLLLGLGGGLPPAERNRQILKASLYVALIMLVSFYGGSLVMQVFGISIPGLRIAGGLIVAYIGFTMLFPATTPDETEVQHDLLSDEEKITPHFRDLSFVPLALPGTAGPGTIALVVEPASTLQSTYGSIPLPIHLAAITVTLLTALVFWIALQSSGRIMRFLGESGIDAISRVVGFLLVAMGVQFVINGGFELGRRPCRASGGGGQAIVADELAQHADHRLDARQFQMLVGLVGTGDVAGAEDQGLAAQALEIRRLGTERHGLGAVPGQALGDAHQLAVPVLLERRHGREQRLVVDRHPVPLGQRPQALADRFAQLLGLHAR